LGLDPAEDFEEWRKYTTVIQGLDFETLSRRWDELVDAETGRMSLAKSRVLARVAPDLYRREFALSLLGPHHEGFQEYVQRIALDSGITIDEVQEHVLALRIASRAKLPPEQPVEPAVASKILDATPPKAADAVPKGTAAPETQPPLSPAQFARRINKEAFEQRKAAGDPFGRRPAKEPTPPRRTAGAVQPHEFAPWRKFDYARDARFCKQKAGRDAFLAAPEQVALREQNRLRRQEQQAAWALQQQMQLNAAVAIAQANARAAQANLQQSRYSNSPRHGRPFPLIPGPYYESVNRTGNLTNISGFGPFGPFNESINRFDNGMTTISGFGAPYPFASYGGYGGGY
jgi:hypothetical protein